MKLRMSSAAGLLAGLVASIALFRPRSTRVDVLRLRDVVDWFVEHKKIKVEGGSVLAFTLLRRPPGTETPDAPRLSVEATSDAPVILVQGFFDEKTGRVLECRQVEANELDEELARTHHENQVVIYE